jgi:hypothetical protein
LVAVARFQDYDFDADAVSARSGGDLIFDFGFLIFD